MVFDRSEMFLGQQCPFLLGIGFQHLQICGQRHLGVNDYVAVAGAMYHGVGTQPVAFNGSGFLCHEPSTLLQA